MKSLRKFTLITVAAVALLGAGLIEYINLLAAKHRDQVTQELQKVLGQDVSFETLEVNVFGRPGFVAREFRIADDSRFAATPVLQAHKLVLGVSLWNLLFRRLVITSLTFDQPEFQIITDESGELNLTQLINRKSELRKFPRLRAPAPERRQTPVSFSIDEVAVKHGRVEYVDRSVKQPAELRMKNISMRLKGFEPDEATRIEVAASLTEGLGQDVRIAGELGPPPENRSWLQRGVDLSIEFDSLYVPVVARAIAVLRDKLPSQLDVTGPMALQVRARGTPERPRLEDIILKVPLLGSSEYNAVIRGDVKFTERRSWEEAELDGTLSIDPLSLARVRKFKMFEQTLPAALVSEGTVRIHSRFAGTWKNLRLGALVRAGNAELHYKDWLHKPAGVPATIRARIAREKHRLVFHDSELDLGANKIDFSGGIDQHPTPRLRLILRNENGSIAAWGKLLAAPGFELVAGRTDLDVTVAKNLVGADTDLRLSGGLKLKDAGLKHKSSGRAIDHLQADIHFDGIKARLENGQFRLGNSHILLNGSAANVFEPRLVSTVRSPELVLADLPGLSPRPPIRFKDVLSQAEIFLENGHWVLTGSLAAPQANLNGLLLRDLRSDIALAPAGLTFKNLRAQTLDGTLRSDGFWPANGEQARDLQLFSQIDAVDVRAILAQLFPPFRDRLEGRLNGHAHFRVNGAGGANAKETLKGTGEASVQQGVIKNFNLISQLLMRGSGSAVSAATMSRVPPAFVALFNRPDTPFDSFNADFTIEQRRVSTENLVIITPDYTITAAGWVAFDRSTRWNGLLVLSRRLTQEVQRDYRIVRYLLDRRGRLAISFRIDGQIPKVTISLENRALAQALGSADGQEGEAPKEGKHWLPDALERFLKR